MSVAFPALALFMYVLPGIVFRRSISTAGQFRRQRSVADEFASGVVLACVGHWLWIWLSNNYGEPVDLKSAMQNAIGQYGKDSADLDRSIKAVTEHVGWVIAYFVSLNIFALGLGSAIRWARLRDWKPFLPFSWFDDEPGAERFREWSGVLPTPSEGETFVPLLATVVELGGTAYLFIGVLDDIHWAEGGSPDRFILSGAIRRRLEDDENPAEAVQGDGQEAEEGDDESRYYSILGDNLIIRASEAKTLNILIRNAGEE